MYRTSRIAAAALAGLLPVTSPTIAEPPPADVPIDEAAELAIWADSRDERMAWWRDARLGMFIHWGLYSPAGGTWDGKVYPQHYAEWIQNWASVPCAEYARQMKPRFQPDEGFADDWADLASKAGMGYAVMTSKHHDGFTLFNSNEPYSLDNEIAGGTNISPEGRDVAREFADAMRAKVLQAGFYSSLLDWQHPDAFPMALPGYPKSDRVRDHAVYRDYIRGHVDELLHGYGPLSTIWFDYSDPQRQGEAWGAPRLMADMRAAQPDILVNNRLYFGLENDKGDYGTPEKYVPPTGLPGMDWEVNHTLNESYGFSSHDANWKSTDEVVRLLCDIVSKGGNLLLNIGPDANGRVPDSAREALLGLGAWMEVHGEAIRGTTASPFERLPWGRATRKGEDVLYLMVFDWPEDGRLLVPMAGQVRHARLLGADVPVRVRTGEGGLSIDLPPVPAHAACSVIRLDLDGDISPTPFAVASGAGGVVTLTPFDATLAGPSIKVERVGVIGDVRHNIGYWLDTAATASWPIVLRANEGGRYAIEGEIGCKDAAAGSEVDILLDGVVVGGFTVPGTGGGWQDYRVEDLGRIEIGPGRHELALKARTKPGEAVVNIRGITLTPTDG